ncbi:MAG: TonB-dependent receptor, partial [Holophagales bacterium]|nr:TonB-dependent receptor [Holophagales bacterium]
LTTRVPFNSNTRTGISLSSVYFGRGSRFGDEDRGSSLVSLRRGWLGLVFDLVGDDEEEQEEGAPEYTDFYAKADWSLDERTELGVWGLWADDTLDSSEREDDGALEQIDSSYGNAWVVGRAQRLWSDSALSKARVFAGQVDRDRLASEAEGQTDFDVRDERTLDIFGLATESSIELGRRHLIGFGLEARSYTADYDYAVNRDFTDPIAGVGSGQPFSSFDDEIEGESYGLWISDRWRLGEKLVAEVGARYDRQTWLEEDDDQFSPRLNLVYDLGTAGVLRFGWGYAHQSQRPNELAIEDGDETFYPAERAEHRTLGWERAFDGWRLRLDAFQRVGTDVRPRYVNLFNPVVLFPEGSPDRARLAPERSEASGVEIFAQGRGGSRLTWWASYALSEVEDRIDGEWIPREIDQTHAFTLNVGYRIGRNWNLDAVWLYHTGWPITGVSARLVASDDGPRIEPVLGPLYGERVADYHRLDLRLGRTYELARGELQLFFDVQNLYNRENERGFEFGEQAFSIEPDGS